jgi:hypothetical protein
MRLDQSPFPKEYMAVGYDSMLREVQHLETLLHLLPVFQAITIQQQH